MKMLKNMGLTALGVMLLASCSKTDEALPVDMVGNEATAVVTINAKTMLADANVASADDLIALTKGHRNIQKLLSLQGVDFKQIVMVSYEKQITDGFSLLAKIESLPALEKSLADIDANPEKEGEATVYELNSHAYAVLNGSFMWVSMADSYANAAKQVEDYLQKAKTPLADWKRSELVNDAAASWLTSANTDKFSVGKLTFTENKAEAVSMCLDSKGKITTWLDGDVMKTFGKSGQTPTLPQNATFAFAVSEGNYASLLDMAMAQSQALPASERRQLMQIRELAAQVAGPVSLFVEMPEAFTSVTSYTGEGSVRMTSSEGAESLFNEAVNALKREGLPVNTQGNKATIELMPGSPFVTMTTQGDIFSFATITRPNGETIPEAQLKDCYAYMEINLPGTILAMLANKNVPTVHCVGKMTEKTSVLRMEFVDSDAPFLATVLKLCK